MSTSPQSNLSNGCAHDKPFLYAIVPSLAWHSPDPPLVLMVMPLTWMVLPQGWQGQWLTLVGSSQGIALSFLVLSQRRTSLHILHPLCIDLLVLLAIILVLEYPATFLCACWPRAKGCNSVKWQCSGIHNVTNAHWILGSQWCGATKDSPSGSAWAKTRVQFWAQKHYLWC